MNPHTTLPTLERQLALFRETRKALGKPPATEIPLIKECYVAPDAREPPSARRGRTSEPKYAAYRQWEQDKALPAGESFAPDFDALARDRFILGDPARVREEIARYREPLGVTTIIFRVQWPGMEQAGSCARSGTSGKHVLPRLR